MISLLCLSHSFASNQNVQCCVFLYIINSFLVGDHREVVSIQLEDLVVNLQPRLAGSTIGSDISNVDSVIGVALKRIYISSSERLVWWPDPSHLRTESVILVDPATNLKAALEVGLRHPWGALLVEDDRDGEAGNGGARLVSES